MTEVAFHFNLPDKLFYTCRLLRKVVNAGMKVVVTADSPLLKQLDMLLWTFSPSDFVSHCFLNGSPAMVSASAVVLTEATTQLPHQQVLLNLGQQVPASFARFERLIELVGQDDTDKLGASQRWKYYADRGYVITQYDLAMNGAN